MKQLNVQRNKKRYEYKEVFDITVIGGVKENPKLM